MPEDPFDAFDDEHGDTTGDYAKHLGLGLDPDQLGDEDPEYVEDEAERDAIWANSTTVEQYKIDIEALAAAARSDDD